MNRAAIRHTYFFQLCAQLILLAAFGSISAFANEELPLKKRSIFASLGTLSKVQENLKKHPDGEDYRSDAIKAAAFWKNLSDDELWEIMFGPTITRSWMVWSNGECPSCRKSVPMYTWRINARGHPWKVRCPHCSESFPKNDFAAFYKSGLDEHGIFNPARADRKLLFNADHPDPADPLHKFGVDDGEGYVEGKKRWRFIGAYLIYGQFKQLVIHGINNLAYAYIYTADPVYARKAGILLDRVADVYPSFDFGTQGLSYEYAPHRGYVSMWHDACEETIAMVNGYDRVFEGLRDNKEFVEFLSKKAAQYKLTNPKKTFSDIQRNIENNILRDVLKNRAKIKSNFPRTDCAEATIMTVLGWPENRTEVEAVIDKFVKQATAVDGVTGEKGLSGYTYITISGMAHFLAEYARIEPDFLPKLIQRVPSLKDCYRFHIDTLCLDRFYPASGDCGSFGKPVDRYLGANFEGISGAAATPSMFTFFWQLYQATGDVDYVRILYRENGRKLDRLPHDLFVEKPETIRTGVAEIIKEHGPDLKLSSVNKQAWRIALLRSGEKESARVVALDYDSGGAHGHQDGMNLALFANGIDLLPDFGYPPVQFGGWETRRALWYSDTASHNTVVVDGRNQQNANGTTTLWADGRQIRAIRASAPQLYGANRYERTVVMIDAEKQFYIVDVFRVVGGSDHAKFVHGPTGDLTTTDLNLETAPDYGFGTQMRHFRRDNQPPATWTATWKVRDSFSVLPADKTVFLRYADLSTGVQAYAAEAWIAPYFNTMAEEIWNPSLMIRKQGPAPLASTFVSVYESHGGKPIIRTLRRLPLQGKDGEQFGDSDVAIEVEMESGVRDLLIVSDPDRVQTNSLSTQRDWNVKLSGELAWVRKDSKNRVIHAALCRGSKLEEKRTLIESKEIGDFVEVDLMKR
jgi:hypothetical protein